MILEEAIQTAMAYETRIRDLYRQAAEKANDPVGKRLFTALGNDEDSHLAYLNRCLRVWRETGRLAVAYLASVIPSREAIAREVGGLETRLSRDDRHDERRMLSKALAVEVETSDFYRRMVQEMTDESRPMFARFLEIEDGHIAMVQAELDFLTNTGYWLDFKEFDME